MRYKNLPVHLNETNNGEVICRHPEFGGLKPHKAASITTALKVDVKSCWGWVIIARAAWPKEQVDHNAFRCYLYSRSRTPAGVVKLVDTLALGASAARCGGSSPLSGTKKAIKSATFHFKLRFLFIVLRYAPLRVSAFQ